MRKVALLTGAALLTLSASLAPDEASASEVFVVHGIPGADLGLDPALPVDIGVDGACFETVRFGDVLGPVQLDAGRYRVQIRLADEGNPCKGTLAVTGAFDLSAAETAIAAAHLDVNGAPRLTKFTTRAAPDSGAESGLTVYHTAAAPAVDIRLRAPGEDKPVATITGLKNGEQSFPALVPSGSYEVAISPAAGRHGNFLPPIAKIPFDLADGVAYAVFAVGSLDNETFDVVPVAIEDAGRSE